MGIQKVLSGLADVILDKERYIKLVVSAFIAGGHVLIEDIPGTGKTTLAKALARLLGLEFKRIQCTNDLLPADILGSQVFDKKDGKFIFRPGPVFANVVLVDEINRATPRTQSGLLEVMGEAQVTVDRESYLLPRPFFVIATQNPLEQVGTYPLPESQMDRFMIRISLGYPSREAEILLLKKGKTELLIRELSPIISEEEIKNVKEEVDQVFVSDNILSYIVSLVNATRENSVFKWGLSPRSSLAILKMAKAWAYIEGRTFVLPEDVKEVFIPCSSHRLRSISPEMRIEDILFSISKTIPII